MKVITAVARLFGYIGGIATIALLAVMVTDVIMRRFFGRPIVGATEVAQLSMVFIFLAAPLTTLEKKNIKVDTLMAIFSGKVQFAIDMIIYLVTIAFSGVLAWRAYQMSFLSRRLGADYSLLRIPEYPMLWVVSLCFALIGLSVIGLMITRANEVTSK